MIYGYSIGDLTRTVTHENNRNLVDTVANSWDTALVSQFDYTNDKAGRRTAREDSGPAFASTHNNIFGYNARSEVTSATMRNGLSSYSFDQIGNRVEVQTPDEPNPVAYLANALNQYTAINVAAASPPQITPTHDDDGNLVDDGNGTTFEWNAENRMIRVHKGDLTIENTYDGQGRRVRKLVIDDGTPIEDHRYFYDGWNLIFEHDILALADTKYYVWGLDLSQSLQGAGGVGGLLLVRQGANAWAPTFDANGNISEYINLANGNVDAHLEYDAFGRKIVSTGNAPSNFGFSTKYEDTETGYLYYGFRYYDSQTGRWPNRDPLDEWGSVNLYAFVNNDVVNRSDLLGLLDWRGYFRGEQGWLPGDQSGIRKNLDQAKAYGKGFLEGLSHEARTDYWADRINDHYDRNEILSANCQEMEVFRGRTDIADQEIARFVQDNREKGVTKIDQDKNIFHQPSEDSNCTNGDHSKFRNHKWVYGLLYGQNNDSVIFRPCEFILRKNGCWKNDCTFEDYGTWSWDTDPYTYGTNNYGGGNISHTIYDIVPWMLLGSTREQTNWNDFGDRLRTLF